MPIEFQEFGPKLRRSATKVLFGERVEQLRVRLIVEPIFSRACDCTGVKIVVWQVRLAGVYLD
jgi:hypothetical protein